MADIYSASPQIAGGRKFQTYLNQWGATSGRVPSATMLDQIIQGELDASSRRMAESRRLAEKQRQFDISQKNAADTAGANRSAGLVGTTTNALTTGATLRALTKLPGEPFNPWGAAHETWSATQGPAAAEGILNGTIPSTFPSTVAPTVAGPTVLASTQAPATTGLAMAPATGNFGVDTALGNMATPELATGAGAETAGFGATTMPYLGPAAAGYAAPGIVNMLGKKVGGFSNPTESLGKNLSLGLVQNEKSADMVGSTAVGAGAGALIGAQIGAVGGPAGALVGAGAGLLSSVLSDTWICTAIETLCGLSASTLQGLSDLRRYSVKHYKEESKKYFKNGHLLVTAINQGELPDMVYGTLKETLVNECVNLVSGGDLELAYQHYKEVVEALCKQYDVDLSMKEEK